MSSKRNGHSKRGQKSSKTLKNKRSTTIKKQGSQATTGGIVVPYTTAYNIAVVDDKLIELDRIVQSIDKDTKVVKK